MGVRDHEPGAPRAAPGEGPRERAPGRPGLRGPDAQAPRSRAGARTFGSRRPSVLTGHRDHRGHAGVRPPSRASSAVASSRGRGRPPSRARAPGRRPARSPMASHGPPSARGPWRAQKLAGRGLREAAQADGLDEVVELAGRALGRALAARPAPARPGAVRRRSRGRPRGSGEACGPTLPDGPGDHRDRRRPRIGKAPPRTPPSAPPVRTPPPRERHLVNDHRVLNRAAWCSRGARAHPARAPRRGLRAARFRRDGDLRHHRAPPGQAASGPGASTATPCARPTRTSRPAGRGLDEPHGSLAPAPWAARVRALPPPAAPVPCERVSCERACRARGCRHETPLAVGRQMALQVRRWMPDRDPVLVADGGLEAPTFLDALRRGGVAAITRPAPDAALREPAPPRLGMIGRPRTKGARLATLRDVLAAGGASWQSARVAGRSRRRRARSRSPRRGPCGGTPACPSCRSAGRWSAIPSAASRGSAPTRPETQSRSSPRASRRRQVEVTLQEARAHLGWARRAWAGGRGAGRPRAARPGSPKRGRAARRPGPDRRSRRGDSDPTTPPRASHHPCSPCSPSRPSRRIGFPPAGGDGPRRQRGAPSPGPPHPRRLGGRARRELARAALGHIGA